MRKSARKNLEKKAEELGANAIIGLEFRDAIGLNIVLTYFTALASGTAVIVEEL